MVKILEYVLGEDTRVCTGGRYSMYVLGEDTQVCIGGILFFVPFYLRISNLERRPGNLAATSS